MSLNFKRKINDISLIFISNYRKIKILKNSLLLVKDKC